MERGLRNRRLRVPSSRSKLRRVSKCIVTNRRYGSRNGDFFQTTIFESVLFNRLNTVRTVRLRSKVHFFKVATTLEYVLTDLRHACRNIYFLNPVQISERIVLDSRYAFGDIYYAVRVVTTAKSEVQRVVANTQYCAAFNVHLHLSRRIQNQRFERRTSVKSHIQVGCSCRYLRRNGCRFKRNAVLERLRTKRRYGVRKNDAFKRRTTAKRQVTNSKRTAVFNRYVLKLRTTYERACANRRNRLRNRDRSKTRTTKRVRINRLNACRKFNRR